MECGDQSVSVSKIVCLGKVEPLLGKLLARELEGNKKEGTYI